MVKTRHTAGGQRARNTARPSTNSSGFKVTRECPDKPVPVIARNNRKGNQRLWRAPPVNANGKHVSKSVLRRRQMMFYQTNKRSSISIHALKSTNDQILKDKHGLCRKMGINPNISIASKATHRIYEAYLQYIGNIITDAGCRSRNEKRKRTDARHLLQAAEAVNVVIGPAWRTESRPIKEKKT